jgi:hypothetical protein
LQAVWKHRPRKEILTQRKLPCTAVTIVKKMQRLSQEHEPEVVFTPSLKISGSKIKANFLYFYEHAFRQRGWSGGGGWVGKLLVV